MEKSIGLKNMLVPFGDLFPSCSMSLVTEPEIESLIFKLIGELLKNGAYGIYVDGGFGRTEIINTVKDRLPVAFRGAIHIIEPEKLFRSEAQAFHFVDVRLNELVDQTIVGSDALLNLIQSIQRWIYFFFVAREFELSLPTFAENGLNQIQQLQELLVEGSTHSRLSNIEGVFKSYARHEIASIDTDEYVWQYIRELEPELCQEYSREFVNLGIKSKLNVAQKKLLDISSNMVKKVSKYKLVYRALDIYEGTKLEKLLKLLPKEKNYVPTYLGPIEPIQRYMEEYQVQLQKIIYNFNVRK